MEDWITFTKDRNFNDRRYTVKAQKLLQLNWTEEVNFDDGINATIEWYRKNKHTFKSH
jgi:dTDP-D-glucose 4,6-dehydratase